MLFDKQTREKGCSMASDRPFHVTFPDGGTMQGSKKEVLRAIQDYPIGCDHLMNASGQCTLGCGYVDSYSPFGGRNGIR